jgi:hypothetical protein
MSTVNNRAPTDENRVDVRGYLQYRMAEDNPNVAASWMVDAPN